MALAQPQSHSSKARQLSSLVVLIGVALFVTLTNGGGVKVPEVTLEEAQALIASGALVIDVRPKDKYDGRHIPGAVSVPLEELEAAIPAPVVAAKDQAIVVYCNSGHGRGEKGTQRLREAGYTKAVNLTSGIEGWAGKGLPVQATAARAG